MIYRVARLELGRFLSSPLSWLIFFAVSVYVSYSVIGSLGHGLRVQTLFSYNGTSKTAGALSMPGALYSDLELVFIVAIPLIFMGIVSRERGSDTYRLLFSSPISMSDIILGKALAQLFICLLLSGLVAVNVTPVYLGIENADIGLIMGGLFGLFLLTLMASGAVLFFSTLTRYPVLDVIATVAFFGVLLVIGNFLRGVPIAEDLTAWFSLRTHSGDLRNGYLTSRDLVFFFGMAALFVYLAWQKLRMDKATRNETIGIGAQMCLSVAMAASIGVFLSQPRYTSYHDLTATQLHTADEQVQAVLGRIDGQITITTFVNVLDNNVAHLMADSQRFDKSTFDRYRRFKPGMSFDYRYYYKRLSDGAIYSERERGMSEEALLEERLKRFNLDADSVAPASEVLAFDLADFDFGHVRLFTADGRQTVVAAGFNDPIRRILDEEMLAALEKLTAEPPVVGLLNEHGERSIKRYWPTGWRRSLFAAEVRKSMPNLGFDVKEITFADLREGKAPDYLVIADPKDAYSGDEIDLINRFIDAGGNALIALEPTSAAPMNDVLRPLGVELRRGMVVNGASDMDADRAPVTFNEAADWFRDGDNGAGANDLLRSLKRISTLKTAGAIDTLETGDFSVTPLFFTGYGETWLDLDGPDEFGAVSFDPLAQEERGEFLAAVALDRNIAGENQRVLVFADADFLSDAEVGRASWVAQSLAVLLTGGERPAVLVAIPPSDTRIKVSPGEFRQLRLVFWGAIPGLIAALGLLIWMRRRAR